MVIIFNKNLSVWQSRQVVQIKCKIRGQHCLHHQGSEMT